jgi:hypothetical protein
LQIREEGLNQKKKKMKGLYDFLHGWNAIRRRKRRKIKKKRKTFLSQTTPNYNTHVI